KMGISEARACQLLMAQVLDRAAVQLAGAGFADAHLLRRLAERERIPVVAREDLTLPRRQALQGALDAHPEVLVLVAIRRLVVRGPVAIAGFEQQVQRQGQTVRADLRLGVRHIDAGAAPFAAGVVVDAPELVEDGATDPQPGVPLEWDAAGRVVAVDGVDQTDEGRRLDIVAPEERSG